MASSGFLTTRARVLLCIAHDPGARLRDIAATLGVAERLAQAGHLIRQKDGRRNRHQVQAHLRCPDPVPANPPSEPESSALAGDAVSLEVARQWTHCSSPRTRSTRVLTRTRADHSRCGASMAISCAPRPSPGSSASRP